MQRRQQHLVGRVAGYHRLARWVAAHQPLSLATPRIALPPSFAPAAVLHSSDDDAQVWPSAAERAFSPARAAYEPELAGANVVAEWSAEPSTPLAEPDGSSTIAPASHGVADSDPRQQREGQRGVDPTSALALSGERDDRAAASTAPDASVPSADPVPVSDGLPQDGAGHHAPIASPPAVARAVPPSAHEVAAPDDALFHVEVARGATPPSPAPPSHPAPNAPRGNDADEVGPGGDVRMGADVPPRAAPPELGETDPARDPVRRHDRRPPARLTGGTRTDQVDTHSPMTTGDGAEAANDESTGDEAEAANGGSTGDGADIELVVPRRPRPQPSVPVASGHETRPPPREIATSGADTAATETATGQARAGASQTPANQQSPAVGAPLRAVTNATPAVAQVGGAGEELFAPREDDRSPESWVARLTGRAPAAPRPPLPSPAAPPLTAAGPEATPVAEQPPVVAEMPERRTVSMIPAPPAIDESVSTVTATPVAVRTGGATGVGSPIAITAAATAAASSSPEADSPPPLPDTTRRFLQPLVGIDPASVRVYHDPVAAQLAARANADALAVGDAVALGAGHLPGAAAPGTLGLLAHELTHIARGREPRFVPPIARTAGHRIRAGNESALPTNEEGLARLVEARVTRVAESALTPERHSSALPSGAPDPFSSPLTAAQGPTGPTGAESADTEGDPVRQAMGTDPPSMVSAAWNGLPAPWEPLPTWLGGSGSPTVSALPMAVVSPATPVLAAQGVATAAPVVQLAEHGRALDEAAPAVPAAPPAAHSPEPDLDALARQVYAVLRRRLSAEGRRAR